MQYVSICTARTVHILHGHCPINFWPICGRVSFWARVWSKPNTQRQATQHDCLPRCLAMGTNKVKKCAVWKIIFCTWLTRATKAGKKIYCTGTTSPTNQPRKDTFHMCSKSPHLPQFQSSSQQLATPLWYLWLNHQPGWTSHTGCKASTDEPDN